MRTFVVSLVLLAASSTASAQRSVRVIASNEVEGRFATPICHHGQTLVPADHAAFTYALSRSARDEDHPMVLDTGGLLTPHGVARYAAQERPSSLATLVQRLGYRALAFGQSDLGASRRGTLAVARELRERGIPWIASNLRCGEGAERLCALLVDASDGPSIQEAGGMNTAVLSVLREDALELVAPDRARGLALEPPRETLIRMTRLAREQGAEIVVWIVDAGAEGGPMGLASDLPEEDRPELVLAAGDAELFYARPRSIRPVLVGAPSDDAVEILIRESDLLREGYDILAQPLGGRGITVAQPVLDWMERIGPSYCAAWGRPLEGGALSSPIDSSSLLSLAARIVREATGADVAVIHRQALDAAWSPSRPDALTASDVFIALEYDDPLQAAEVDEAWLKSLARNAGELGLATPGLTWTDGGGSIEIDGHPSEARAHYRVVTVRYLAAGGHGALPPLEHGAHWENVGDATLRSIVLRYLEAERERDPREVVSDPEETLQWIFRGGADLSFSGSAIDNPPRRCDEETPPETCVDGVVAGMTGMPVRAYGTSLLNRSDTLTFGVTIDLAADAAAPDWTWQNNANLTYRTAWVQGTGGRAGTFAEAVDQIRGRSTLSWRGLRQDAGQWYVPDPTVDLFVESEVSEPSDREWHWLLIRPTAGVRFQLLDRLQIQLVGGIQMQPFDPQMRVEPGVGATLTLAAWDFLKWEDRYARLAFTLDYFLADLGDSNRSQLRGQLDASFDLAGPLALVFTARLFVQGERDQDVGAAIDATASLRLAFFGRATGP